MVHAFCTCNWCMLNTSYNYRISNMQHNLNKYEQQLSPFGKSVLKTLINQWKGEGKHREETCIRLRRNSKAFRPEEQLLNVKLSERSASFGTEKITYRPEHVLKSTELVKAIDVTKFVKTSNVITDDSITPPVNRDQLGESCEEHCNFNLERSKSSGVHTVTATEKEADNSSIAWENMFDTELFNDITNFNKENIQQENVSEIEYSQVKDITSESKEVNNNDVNKKAAAKKRTAGLLDANLKKVKKLHKGMVKPKTSCRKQKYTKAVKNWLNAVDPKNPVEEEVLEKTNDNNVCNPKTEALDTGITKKVVQSRLANKDGIMKFSLAKNMDRVDPVKDTPNVKGSVKQRRTKFVAPIKSQIEIKDIAYDIITVCGSDKGDAVNAAQHLDAVRSAEVTLVLCYRNGLCQLNYQHTGDSCVPEAIMLYVNEKFYYFKDVAAVSKNLLTIILENNKIICYEGKHVLNFLKLHFLLDINVSNILDAKIAGRLLDVDNPPERFSDLQKLVSFVIQYTISSECVMQKAAWYLTMLRDCWLALQAMLVEQTLWDVFVNIEMRLLPIIAGMEHRGVCVDISKLTSMEEMLLARMKRVEQECYKAAGKTFQINSTAQVRAILYDELQLDTKCNIKIIETVSKGAKSTSETMLRSLASLHPLPQLILEYRHLHKAHATFLSGIKQHIKNGTVKPTWEQTAAATGRIASSNPNLQAIPKAPFCLDTHPDGDHQASGGGAPLCLRSVCAPLCFRSVYTARAGCALLAADFRHIECRVLAHGAADGRLLAALGAHQDLFRVLASAWLGVEVAAVSAAQRARTKRVVYALVYGAGGRSLAAALGGAHGQSLGGAHGQALGGAHEKALGVLASFNRTFPSLKSFGREVVSRCKREGGRLRTMGGRVRVLPNIASGDAALRAQAERQAVNFVVQGSAADLCKLAMVQTERSLRSPRAGLGARLVLQVHDELVWELPDHALPHAAALIKQVMEDCGREVGMSIPLPVAISSGSNWGEMAPVLL